MWIVRLALRRPYTFVVMAMLIVLLGGVTIARMPTDMLHLAAVHPPLLVPASALLLGAEGTAVLVVGPDQKIHRKPIVIEGDYGADLGVADGINDDDRVVSNPSERLVEGLPVDVVVPPPPAGSASGVAPPAQTAPPLPAASAAAGTR